MKEVGTEVPEWLDEIIDSGPGDLALVGTRIRVKSGWLVRSLNSWCFISKENYDKNDKKIEWAFVTEPTIPPHAISLTLGLTNRAGDWLIRGEKIEE